MDFVLELFFGLVGEGMQHLIVCWVYGDRTRAKTHQGQALGRAETSVAR